MDDKTLQALTALAEKLGTTAEYLWGALLKQAPITGLIDLIVMVAWIAAVVLWFRLVRRKTTKPLVTEANPYPQADWSDEVSITFAWICTFVFAVVVMLIVGSNLSNIAGALFNPEYWALKQVWK